MKNNGATLDFLTTGELEAASINQTLIKDHVNLTTTSVSSELGNVPASTGVWSLVSITTVPECADTLLLFFAATVCLGAYRYFGLIQIK